MTPQRIQRRRTKGWRMPENTVYVGRGSRWGNPFKAGEFTAVIHLPGTFYEPGERPLAANVGKESDLYIDRFPVIDTAHAVRLFESAMTWNLKWWRPEKWDRPSISELAGKNLACWCPLDQPCHADVLLELANKETP